MSLPPPSPTDVEHREQSGEFSQEERNTLLQLAHEAIISALEGREIPLDPPTSHFAEPRGAFTSLYLNGQLRGCVGYVLPTSSVYRAVAETARAAAFEDTRFYPVTIEEARHLQIELSIRSRRKPLKWGVTGCSSAPHTSAGSCFRKSLSNITGTESPSLNKPAA